MEWGRFARFSITRKKRGMIELRPRGYTSATMDPGLQVQKYADKMLPRDSDIMSLDDMKNARTPLILPKGKTILMPFYK